MTIFKLKKKKIMNAIYGCAINEIDVGIDLENYCYSQNKIFDFPIQFKIYKTSNSIVTGGPEKASYSA